MQKLKFAILGIGVSLLWALPASYGSEGQKDTVAQSSAEGRDTFVYPRPEHFEVNVEALLAQVSELQTKKREERLTELRNQIQAQLPPDSSQLTFPTWSDRLGEELEGRVLEELRKINSSPPLEMAQRIRMVVHRIDSLEKVYDQILEQLEGKSAKVRVALNQARSNLLSPALLKNFLLVTGTYQNLKNILKMNNQFIEGLRSHRNSLENFRESLQAATLSDAEFVAISDAVSKKHSEALVSRVSKNPGEMDSIINLAICNLDLVRIKNVRLKQ